MAAQTILNKYFQDMERELKADGAYKASLLEKLRSDLEDFLEEHPEATEAQLRQFFGSPEDYAREYTATLDPEELCSKVSHGRFHRKLLISVAAAVLAVIIGLALWIGIRNSQSACDYYDYAVSEGSILPTEDIRWGPSAH